jgi:hypothetical protein
MEEKGLGNGEEGVGLTCWRRSREGAKTVRRGWLGDGRQSALAPARSSEHAQAVKIGEEAPVAETTARAHGRAGGAQIQAPGEVVRACRRVSEDGG